MKFKDVEWIGFDLDHTLYPFDQALSDAIRTEISGRVALIIGVSQSEAFNQINELRKVTGSTSKALELMGVKNARQLEHQVFDHFNVVGLLKRDDGLAKILLHLSSRYKLFLVTNTSRSMAHSKLEKIGIDIKIFSEVLCGGELNAYKGDGSAFKEILRRTNLPAEKHVFIGDNEIMDIIPAKAVRMKAVKLLGTDETVADLKISSIHEIEKLFL